MEAAKISAGPSAANAALVRRVDRLLNGDYTRLADWVMSRPQGKVLAPFVRATVHPAETDRAGRTAICNAVLQLNAEAVREQLEAGADPNGACGDGGETLVGYLVYMATREQVPERRAVLRELLSHGAKPVRVDVCRSPDVGDCREVLLPLLEQYSR
jgi:hypothetical protein